MTTADGGLVVEDRDRVVYARIDRPKALNAIDEALVARLDALLERIERDEEIRALVITGTGETFCVGMDLACLERGFRDHAYFRAFLERLARALLRMEALPVPVVAAANGLTRAGGLEILLACDLVLAADEARIADDHGRFAVLPGGGSTQRLPRKIGPQRAADLILTARWIDGPAAVEYGLALRSVPRAALAAAVEDLVDQLRGKSRAFLGAAKAAMRDGAALRLADATQLEIDRFIEHLELSPDAQEGFTAYREKRPPRWSMR